MHMDEVYNSNYSPFPVSSLSRLPYTSLFGGVTVLTTDQFRDVNGFSNMYWGWGGEDDDMFTRIFSRGYSITRPPEELARYKMSLHHRDKGNKANPMRYEDFESNVFVIIMVFASSQLSTWFRLKLKFDMQYCKKATRGELLRYWRKFVV